MPLSFFILAIFFLFTSFAFGCMENWSIATAEVILFLGAAASGFANRDFWSFPKRLKAVALFILVLITVAVIQLIPLPVSFWNYADRDRITAYEEGLKSEELLQSEKYRIDPFEKTEIPAETERYTPQMSGWLTLSLSPISTFKALIALFSGLCLILLLEDLARVGESYLRNLALLVGCSGLGVGLLALAGKSMEIKTHIMGIRESGRAERAFGPFVNGNHGEAFINLTIPLLCYLIWRKSKDVRKTSNLLGLRIMTIAFVLFQAALVVTGTSRGNFLAVSLLPIIGLFHMGFYGKNKIAIAAGFSLLLLLILTGSFMIHDGYLTDPVRNQMNLNAVNQLSVMGKGLDTFEETFPSIIEKWYIYAPMRNEYLENEYLQIFYEGGIIPFACSLLLCGFVVCQAFRLVFLKGARFWLIPPVIAEGIRAGVDMNFHVFPIVGVYLLIFIIASRTK